MNYRRLLIGASVLLSTFALPAPAQNGAKDFSFSVADGRMIVRGFSIEKTDNATGTQAHIQMSCLFDSLTIPSNQYVVLRPVLYAHADGQQTTAFAPIVVAGRRQYLLYQRNGHLEPDYTDAPVLALKEAKRQGAYIYKDETSWQPWMEGAEVRFAYDICHCCDSKEQPVTPMLARLPINVVERLCYAMPAEVKGEKTYHLKGAAFINFVVDRTDVRPDYMNNPHELRKITDTLDVMVGDPNVTVEQIRIHGYASPESPYLHNKELATHRAQVLTDYIQTLYSLPAEVYAPAMATPENWSGLYEAVEKGRMTHREEMLDIIRKAKEVPEAQGEQCDRLEWLIKSRYPVEYKQLLTTVYPHLRRSDYYVTFVVKKFAVNEAKEVLKSHPAYLSAEELAALVASYPVGSKEYINLFSIADQNISLLQEEENIHRFNLVMATAALKRGDAATASRYLDKAGNSVETENARGALHLIRGDYDAARNCFNKAEGLKETKQNLLLLQNME